MIDLSQFPRLRTVHLPTPLEPLDNLSRLLGGPRIWIKRDDCTGLATGGNKARKLDFLLAEALESGATAVITQGATQSNHVRQTAALAAKLGLACFIFLEQRVQRDEAAFNDGGNVLLDRLLGAKLRIVSRGYDTTSAMQELAAELGRAGRAAYVIPTGGSNPTGCLGYVEGAGELLAQAAKQDVVIDEMVLPTGSAGTHAGLLAGLAANGSRIPVLGISVGKQRADLEPIVRDLAQCTVERLGIALPDGCQDVRINSDYVGKGYGEPTGQAVEAIKLVARTEGILLDPVYTGKAMAGLIDRIRRGEYARARNVVFLHTGGSAGLFGYQSIFEFDDDSGE